MSLCLEPGTVTVLAGENGAGKSTLMKIISGQLRPDTGEVLFGGEPLAPGDVHAARGAGVGIVPQELAPIPDLSIYENLFVGREKRTRTGLLDRRGMIRAAREMLTVFGIDLDPRTPMRRLSVGMTQLVEIVKNTSWGARVVLLDEPTSAISDREVERLFTLVDQLRERGVAIVYTTHKMAEIQAVADRVVVLRDGRLVADEPLAALSEHDIVQHMIGRELSELFPERPEPGTEVALRVGGVRRDGAPPVDLEVRAGEIVGLAGLIGAGRTELLETLFGVRARTGGEIEVGGRRLRPNRVTEAIASGMALVPEDRKGAGLVLSMDVLDNGSLPHLGAFSVAGWLRSKARAEAVGSWGRTLGLRSRGLSQEVQTLSGGNQQKVVLGRWLSGDVKVLLLDEPTRGVDIGARSEIYRAIIRLAESGLAVLMASSDMAEVIGLSHRLLVMRGGGVVAELDRRAMDAPDVQERIFRHAAGLHVA
ncbi:sugar ABC transporter ATP-binding protein [Microtetraspora niveoalba]|uniref:sugar ABC transporter ATP-binding protein n=1 Tax=Microtetraspora niveoalba TaxID=46175 RepID=UPI001C3F4538|nr:sugar ABC transporter ATP-binding protein [Microtetraspora niveoalba]